MKILLVIVSQASFARAYGGPDHDWAVSIAQAHDGGFVVAGSSWGFSSVWIDILFLKLSPSGTIEWAKTCRGDGPEWASGVFQAPDGGYAITGHTRSFGAQGTDFLVTKLSSSGSLEWARMVGGEDHDYSSGAVQSSDSGYVVTGGRYRGPEGWDLVLLKLSRAGDLEWARTMDGGGLDYGESVIQAADGGFVVAGWTLIWGAGRSDFLVARFSPTGTPEWAMAYGGPEHDAAKAIVQAPDGGFLVAGETWGFGAGISDILLVKIAADGSPEWGKTYGGPGIDRAISLAGTPDGGCVVSGQTRSFGAGRDDLLVMKLASNGDLEWAETFGGAYSDSVGRTILLADSGLAIVGSTGSWGAGLSDIFVLRLPVDGSYPGCIVPCSPAVAEVTPSENAPVFVAGASGFTITGVNPLVNPCSPSATDICPPSVEESRGYKPGPGVTCSPFPGGALFNSSVDILLGIYAVDGRLVYSGELKQGQNRISLETGVYFWRAGVVGADLCVCPVFKGKAVVR
jgi:hypothetical protein